MNWNTTKLPTGTSLAACMWLPWKYMHVTCSITLFCLKTVLEKYTKRVSKMYLAIALLSWLPVSSSVQPNASFVSSCQGLSKCANMIFPLTYYRLPQTAPRQALTPNVDINSCKHYLSSPQVLGFLTKETSSVLWCYQLLSTGITARTLIDIYSALPKMQQDLVVGGNRETLQARFKLT